MSATQDEHVEAVIVGAGAAGSTCAALLAEGGRTVRVLESGPARRSDDLYSSQIWSRRLYWSTPAVEDPNHSVHFSANAGSGIGGAAVHQAAMWPRFQIEDFKRRSIYGDGLDWPIDYAALRPYYDAVQREVGLSGDAEAEIWRPPGEPYPLPPLHIFRHSEVLKEGFEKLDMHVSPAPLAILSRPYKGRAACVHDGWCLAGCPIGAVGNPLVTYIPRALRAGARFDADCHVLRVTTDSSGRRATGVEYVDRTGRLRRQGADLVVLAAFTVENVRLLLNSGSTRYPEGLANSSGLLGKYLMSHSGTSIYGLFDEDLQSYLGVPAGNLYSQDREPRFRAGAARGGGRHWQIGLTMKPADLFGVMMTRPDLFGRELARFLINASRSLTAMLASCENSPSVGNRIELSDQPDQYGMRAARVIFKPTPEGQRLTAEAKDEGLAVTRAAGAHVAWVGPTVSHHLVGGAIMGTDPSASVTDSFGRTHDVANLVIVGPSVFPTISHANPTFTIQALAMRTVEHLLADWQVARAG